MKRGKGICAAVLMGLVGGMTGAVVSASADAGGRGQPASSSRVAVVADAAPTAQSSDPGNTRGGGGSGGGDRGGGGSDSGSSSQVAQVGSGGGAGNGNSQGGAGGNPQGGTGSRDRGSSSGSSGSDGSSGSGSERSQSGSGSGYGGSGGSGGSQGSGAAPGRGSGSNAGGNGNGNGNSGGDGGGSSIGGQSGRCSSGCHITQQPGTTGTVTFTPAPGQKTTPTTPVTPPVTTPVTPPTVGKPKHGLPTSTTYLTSATPIPSSNHNSVTGVVGLGTTVSPAVRAGTVATGSALPTASQGAIANLIGGTPAIRSSTHSGYRRSAAPTRPTTVTQPVAQQTFIGSIEQVVPPVIWLALAAALAVGGLSAGWAVYSGHRVRRQAGALAAMSTAALTDQLTGVLNRRGFLEAVERELARAKRYDRGFVLAYVDVRGLKGVNDTEGHHAGDELLKEAASLLQDSARADDVVGRLGGDEMGLLLVEQGAEGADAVRRRVAAQVPDRREKLGLHSSWDLTIGTAAYPEDGETVDDLLRVADLRLYEQRGIDLLDRAPA